MKFTLITLLLLSCLSCVVLSATNCTEFNDCGSCTTNDPACGWCTATQECRPGNKTGPTDGSSCIHAWEYEYCKMCQKLTDCRSCNHFPEDCFWCADKGTCLPIGWIGCKYATECPCEDYSSCSSCAETGECSWCGDKEVCIDMKNTSYQCNRLAECTCDLNPTCGSCLDDPTCGWCDHTASCEHKMGTQCAFTTSCELSCSRAAHSCSVCNKVKGCGWCPSKGTCMDINTETSVCSLSLACSGDECGRKFDAGSFVGGFFLMFGLALFAAAGWLWYTKRGTGSYSKL